MVDPGPVEEGHLDLLDEQTGDVGLVLRDPPPLRPLRDRRGARPPQGLPGARRGARRTPSTPTRIADGEVIEVDGLRLEAVFTPGHTDDSLSLLLPAEKTLLTGDMVLGRGTTVIAWPDGDLGLVLRRRSSGCATSPPPVRWRRSGRRTARCSTTRSGCSSTTSSTAASGSRRSRAHWSSWTSTVPDLEDEELPRQVVEIVYQDVDESLWGAAEWSVRAQLAYLAAR